MPDCTRCARKTDLYLCSTCIGNLRSMLHDMPWYLDRLVETAIGQARISDTGRRAKRRDVLHGDDSLAAHIEAFPRDGDKPPTKRDLLARQKLALHHALAAGRVNGRASDLLQKIHNTLAWWVKDICTRQNASIPRLNTVTSMVRWLEKHCATVAHQDDGLNLIGDVEELQKSIERIVNRPVAPMVIGPCVTDPAPDDLLEQRAGKGDGTTRCNYALHAGQKANKVTCPQCDETHDVSDVLTQNLAELDEVLVTVRDLVDWVLPRLDEPVPQRTIERWIVKGWVPVRGQDSSGANMVTIGDVRRARATRPRHAKAG